MPQTWQREPGDDVSCPRCRAVYSVVVQRLPTRDQDKFNCEDCGHEVARWNSTISPVFTLTSHGPGKQGT